MKIKKDPIKVLEDQCLKAKFISVSEFKNIRDKAIEQVDKDAEWADGQDYPDPNTALDHIYSNDDIHDEPSYNAISDKIVIVDAINHALHEEMARNKNMVIYGLDIADPKGGVFTAP